MVFTLPSSISGKPVYEDTSITGIPKELISLAVPPVDIISIPSLLRVSAKLFKPVLSHTPAKPSVDQKTASAEAVEKILIPLSDSLKQSSVGLIDQIKTVSPFQAPSRIKIAYDTFDQTLAYQGAIRRRIEEHKRYPPFAVKKGLEGSVDVQFLLYSNGRAEQVEIVKSSQIVLLDEAAVHAVQDGNPFPPFPESISQDSMLIEVTLNFELHRRY